jgi:hypothetical protein
MDARGRTREDGVIGFGRFAAIVAVLAVPCAWWGDDYEALLLPGVQVVIGALGRDFTLARLETLAPLDIAFFTALCFADSRLAWRRRARAWLVGLPLMWVIEVCIGAVIVWRVTDQSLGVEWPRTLDRAVQFGFASFPWIASTLLACLLLGPEWSRLERGRRPSEQGTGASRLA